jgi:hypothetical protein
VAWKEHDDVDDHASYYLGVIVGISDAQHRGRRDVQSMETESGQGMQMLVCSSTKFSN